DAAGGLADARGGRDEERVGARDRLGGRAIERIEALGGSGHRRRALELARVRRRVASSMPSRPNGRPATNARAAGSDGSADTASVRVSASGARTNPGAPVQIVATGQPPSIERG